MATNLNLSDELKKIFTDNLVSLQHVEIINESSMHSVPKNSQTHFKVFLVSPQFEGVLPVQRHRMVYSLVKPFLRDSSAQPSSPEYYHQIHALSIIAKTPAEWDKEQHSISKQSPRCLGGESKQSISK
jgi:stress-induced morphogen